jgi:hypothetical protein
METEKRKKNMIVMLNVAWPLGEGKRWSPTREGSGIYITLEGQEYGGGVADVSPRHLPIFWCMYIHMLWKTLRRLKRSTLSPQFLDYSLKFREYEGKKHGKLVPYGKRLRVHAALYHLYTGCKCLFIQLGIQELRDVIQGCGCSAGSATIYRNRTHSLSKVSRAEMMWSDSRVDDMLS